MSFIQNSGPVRVALYVRVSTEEQSRDGFGADMQLNGLRETIKHRSSIHNWTHNENHTYIDLWCTGADLNRPEYKRMMDDAKKGKFDVVAVWKIDRLSRNLSHLLSTFEILQDSKVSFFSLKENIDFSGPIGRLTFQIFWALAEFERETIKMRTQEWKIASARLGNYVNPTTPYWYMRKDVWWRMGKTLEIVEDEAIYVRKIFEDFTRWKSMESIATELNNLKVLKWKWTNKKRRDTRWLSGGIRTILKNNTYAWFAIFNARSPDGFVEQIEMKVPNIVPVIMFEMAKNRLESLSANPKHGWGEHEYLLSRKIIDTETQRKMVGVHRTKWWHSYRRKWFTQNGETYRNRELPGEKLEEHIWGLIEKIINRPEDLFTVHQKQSLTVENYDLLNQERARMVQEVTASEWAENSILLDHSYGKVSEERKDAIILDIFKKRDTANRKIIEIDKQLDAIVKAQATKELILQFSQNFKMGVEDLNFEQRHYLVDLLVDSIEITWGLKVPKMVINLRFDQKKLDEIGLGYEPKKSSGITNSENPELVHAENGATERARTSDLILRRDALFQLSYGCMIFIPNQEYLTLLDVALRAFLFHRFFHWLFRIVASSFWAGLWWEAWDDMTEVWSLLLTWVRVDYRDYFRVTSFIVKFTFTERQPWMWGVEFLYPKGGSNSRYRRGQVRFLDQRYLYHAHTLVPYL